MIASDWSDAKFSQQTNTKARLIIANFSPSRICARWKFANAETKLSLRLRCAKFLWNRTSISEITNAVPVDAFPLSAKRARIYNTNTNSHTHTRARDSIWISVSTNNDGVSAPLIFVNLISPRILLWMLRKGKCYRVAC